MILNNLHLLIHRYCISYRYDVSGINVTQTQILFQMFKTLLIIIFFIYNYNSLFNIHIHCKQRKSSALLLCGRLLYFIFFNMRAISAIKIDIL